MGSFSVLENKQVRKSFFSVLFIPYNKSFIDQASSVKMTGYWPRSLFTFLWTSTSSTISHRREITKKTLMNGENNAKGLERRLHITIRNFKRQVTHKHGTDWLVSGGDRNRDVSKEEGGSLKEIVPVLGSLACNADLTVLQELDSSYVFNIKGL